MIDGNLRFTPRFPWRPGIRYRATFVASNLSHPSKDTLLPESLVERDVALEFMLPKQSQGTPVTVRAVYPSRDVLPENQLKFYVHFSAPMSRRNSYRHIQLLDESGNRIDDPFLELGEELWDPSGTRFTLLIDPGRIKRGLKPRQDVGPVLEEGKAYVLVIDSKWLDTTGNPLDRSYRKSFRATAADFTQPDSHRWQIQIPAAGSRDPLVVEFTEPLDHAMLQRAIWIKREAQIVPGSVEVGNQESVWKFLPAELWPEGQYRLIADATLEDLAGNSLGRPFEFTIGQKDVPATPPKTVERRFEIAAPSNRILRRCLSDDAHFPKQKRSIGGGPFIRQANAGRPLGVSVGWPSCGR